MSTSQLLKIIQICRNHWDFVFIYLQLSTLNASEQQKQNRSSLYLKFEAITRKCLGGKHLFGPNMGLDYASEKWNCYQASAKVNNLCIFAFNQATPFEKLRLARGLPEKVQNQILVYVLCTCSHPKEARAKLAKSVTCILSNAT